ncbi:hypothetical protein EJB05_39888 [Eragrostis curvula]|uniref:Embryo surrounding factor 1 brassicaceae domain-containing protein n=1 Tax=Eragrostis curvula TaxID=38414 RepID=A0A5J9TYB4_9POAL|nr:hypothetical protein EJB05_39888 [Eragrostis curvula]
MTVTGIVFIVLLACFLASAQGGRGSWQLGEDESTIKDYTHADNYSLMGVLKEDVSNNSEIVTIFCIKRAHHRCLDNKCYCCLDVHPEPCFESRDECRQHCERCDPNCHPPLLTSSDVGALHSLMSPINSTFENSGKR